MMRVINKGWPLLFGAVRNKHSMIAIDNLIAFIRLCMSHPAAASQTFLISDKQALSTSELMVMLAQAMNCDSRLFPFPMFWMKFFTIMIGKKTLADKLLADQQINPQKAIRMLDWEPVVTPEEAMMSVFKGQINHL